MIHAAISSLILLLFVVPLFVTTGRAKKRAYQWWHIPCFALLYVLAAYLLFHIADVSAWPGFNTLYEGYLVEVVYVLLCSVVWQGIRLYLCRESIHNKLIVWYRKGFSARREDRDKVLPFPYFIDHIGMLRSRVGKPFYQRMLGGIIIIVALVYVVFFLLIEYFGIDFYLMSSFGLFGLLPLVEYHHYLKADVPEEEQKEVPTGGNNPLPSSDLEKLWKLYVETFPNYSVAWKRKFHFDKESGRNNLEKLNDLMLCLTGSGSYKGEAGLLENCNLVEAFTRIAPLFDWAKESGRLVLLVIDIPNHFSKNSHRPYLHDIADELKRLLKKDTDLKVYDEFSPESDLNTSILVASVSVLSLRDLNLEWMKRIGLVTVVNLFDKSVSNLYECLKFSYLLHSVNSQYRMLFITPLLNGVEPAMKNTWLTGSATFEKPVIQYPHSHHQFFIGYNLEDYRERLKQILEVLPSEPLSAGSEMIPIALSHKLGDEDKVITPVHFFDLAYNNIIEGIEELGKYYSKNNFRPVWEEDMNKRVHCHLLPLDVVGDPQVFSVIFDQNNNAPAAYLKWIHLGRQENFTIVLSKPYLFRDYFNANHDFFVGKPFLALQPLLSKSRITLAVILLEILQKSEVTEQQLRRLLQGYYSQDKLQSVTDVVQQLFSTYFANDLPGKLRARHTIVFDGSKYSHQTTYQLDFSDSINLPYLNKISVMDESDNVLFVIIKDLLCQNFDQGQTHAFNGKPYEVISLDDSSKVLKVRAVNTKQVLFYRPVRSVEIGNERHTIEGMNIKPNSGWKHPVTEQEINLDIEGFETNVSVHVDKWYEFCHYSYDSSYFDATLNRNRNYNNGRVLKVTFRFLKKEEYIKRKDDIRKSLQILLYEAMQSVFPHHAQYLVISSVGEGDSSLPWIFSQLKCADTEKENELSFFFIEDAHIDLGLIAALSSGNTLGTGYLFRYIFDYLIWLIEGEPLPAEDYDEYKNSPNTHKFAFLKYGRNSIPDYFDADLLINFIRDFFCKKEEVPELLEVVTNRADRPNTFGVCDFCRTKMKNSEMQRLNDGRMRCPECSVDAVDTDEQFQKLCEKVKAAFKKHLNIDFSTIPHNAKLISAVELHKKSGLVLPITNGYDVRKYVGMAYNLDTDIFYVENGYKPDITYGIIAHELTHIWQYNSPEFIKMKENHEEYVEGLAVWTDLYLSEKNGMQGIEATRKGWLERDDEYGQGLRFIMNTCPDDPYGYIRNMAKGT